MIKSILNELNGKMNKTIDVLKDELNTIRAGKANPKILNRVSLDYYGTQTPLSQIASISAPEPRMLVVQPFDSSMISEVEKAIMIADLGLNPSNDGKIIRLSIPMLTEERRKDLVKQVKKAGEISKVALRNERRHANDALKKLNKSSDLTDDELRDGEKQVQEAVDLYVKKIDELVVLKEEDVMAV